MSWLYVRVDTFASGVGYGSTAHSPAQNLRKIH